jgi:hypothetical protein
MISLLKRKIRLYPLASVVIACLLAGVLGLESGLLFSPAPETALVSDSATVPAPQLAPSAKNTPLEGPTDSADGAPADPLLEVEKILVQETQRSIKGIDPRLAKLLAEKDFDTLRDELLKIASYAVADNDKVRLGYILNLLGQVSIQEQDLYSAEVYLMEALDIFNGLEDEIGVAQINMQLGRTHLRSRQIARVAGTAYDELQVGRWYLAKKIPDMAEKYIRNSIRRNMAINRYGSAASAYESLVRLYLEEGNFYEAQNAAFESARMFAASGRIDRARNVIESVPDHISQQWQLADLQGEIDDRYQEYQDGILQIERARDYRRLYFYYRSQGDQERAWKFRMLASNSLSQVSKRTLFHRQQGVLALLYNSNDAKRLAENYLVRAQDTFDTNGMDTLSEETRDLNRQIY